MNHMSFPGGTMVKNLPASVGNARDAGSIPGSGRSPGGVENPKYRGAWKATVLGVPKSQTRLSN